MLFTNHKVPGFHSLSDDSYFDQISCFGKILFYPREGKMSLVWVSSGRIMSGFIDEC